MFGQFESTDTRAVGRVEETSREHTQGHHKDNLQDWDLVQERSAERRGDARVRSFQANVSLVRQVGALVLRDRVLVRAEVLARHAHDVSSGDSRHHTGAFDRQVEGARRQRVRLFQPAGVPRRHIQASKTRQDYAGYCRRRA